MHVHGVWVEGAQVGAQRARQDVLEICPRLGALCEADAGGDAVPCVVESPALGGAAAAERRARREGLGSCVRGVDGGGLDLGVRPSLMDAIMQRAVTAAAPDMHGAGEGWEAASVLTTAVQVHDQQVRQIMPSIHHLHLHGDSACI